MVTRTRFDPAKHPRGPLGRFVDVTGGAQFQPREDLRSLQGRSINEDVAAGYQINNAKYGPDLMVDFERPSGQDSIDSYVESPFINSFLRDPDTPASALAGLKGISDDDAEADVENYIYGLDEAVEHNELADDVVLYRGVRSRAWDGGALEPGTQIHDRGYLSTALDPGVARNFGDDLMGIEVPAGTAAALGSPHEHEVLLGRGTVLEILGTEIVGVSPRERRLIRTRLVGYIDESVD